MNEDDVKRIKMIRDFKKKCPEAEYLAMESNGQVWSYSYKPSIVDSEYWDDCDTVPKGESFDRQRDMDDYHPHKDWKNSLIKLT